MADSVTAVDGTSYSSTVTRNVSSDLDKDAFLKILVAKLQNQDPLQPTDDTEFLGQLAQYSTLEQITNMNEGTSIANGFNLVGKTVIAEYNDSYIKGRVESVISDSGKVSINVGGVLVSMDDIKEVLAEGYDEDTPTDDTNDTD